MNKDELETLFSYDLQSPEINCINTELLRDLDNCIFSAFEGCEISDEVMSVYKKFQPMKQEAPKSMKSGLFTTIRNFAKDRFSNKKYLEALILYRFLVVKSELISNDFVEIAEILTFLGDNVCALSFIKLYEEKENNLPLKLITLGNFYKLQIKDYKKSIKYYEKYLEIDKTKSVVFTILANLYSNVYGDESLNEQIACYLQAEKLKPGDRLILHGLAFGYEKLGDNINAKKYYLKLLENNPTYIDYYNYGLFLIHCGELYEGHRFFRARFLIDDENLKYPCPDGKIWDLESDISDKTLLVHYEQGFGDTFMYCRFLQDLRNFARKIIFVVQDNLCDLIKNSAIISSGIEVISDKEVLSKIHYDYTMALLDVPYVLKTTKESIPYCGKYLDVSKEKINEYAKKYLKSADKLKIGIAYAGDAKANYNGRDIDLFKFKPITDIEGVEVYSLQYGEKESIDGVFPLGTSFRNFTDTALAIKNMDLVVTTDNVILNLAGALGVKTLGLFNQQTNFRWFRLEGENVGWYNSVRPVQADTQDNWVGVISKVVEIVNNYKNLQLK